MSAVKLIESKEDEGRGERLVLFVLAAVQFTSIVDFMIVMPLGPQLMRSLQVGPAEFGLIVSSYTFAAGVAGLVASSVVDRFSRRTAFLCLYAGFLLGTLLCGLVPSYELLVAALSRGHLAAFSAASRWPSSVTSFPKNVGAGPQDR